MHILVHFHTTVEKLELASWYYGLIYNQIWFTYVLIELKFLGFVDWNIDIHAHYPNKFDPCSLKITVILSLDYPLVLVLIFIDIAIFSKYATLLAFEKKPLIIFSFILHMGFLVPKSSRSCHKKKCSQEYQIQEIMVCIFNIEWIAWVPKSLLYIQNATTVLEGSLLSLPLPEDKWNIQFGGDCG